MALGPHGLGLLSPAVLSYLDPAVSVAIATLGVFVGLGLDARRPQETRLLAAASIEAALTVALVVAGVWLALRLAPFDSGLTPWLFAVLLGICAASSSTTAIERPDHPGVKATRIGDLDDVLTILAGGIALTSIRVDDPQAGASLVVQSAAIALMLALACWLLVRQAASDSEQRVFVLGTLLLLGGAVEYLSLSALFAGLVAGGFWNLAGGPARERIERDVRHVQHPLVVLLLLTAGAYLTIRPGLAVLVPIYLVFRIVGKVAGGWLAGRIAGHERPMRVGLYLVSPGMIAVALALNVLQAVGAERAGLLLAAAIAGSLGSELLSLLVHPREAES
jgi:putative Mn2+ efflux pump MntP